MTDVLCIGILVADIVARPVKEFPKRGKLELVDSIELHTGGCASNTGIALSKLGVRAGVTGRVGKDWFGDFIIRRLNNKGIETRGIKRDPDISTSATVVMVLEDGERNFVHYIGANEGFSAEDIDFNGLSNYKIMHIGGAFLLPKFDGEGMAYSLKRAQTLGLTTSLDTAWDTTGRWLDLIKPCLAHTDIFLPSIEEARELSGEDKPEAIADFFLAHGTSIVGLKMGKKGSLIKTKDEAFHIPAFKVKVVDTTGAGDAFVAGFLAGIIKGWNLEQTGKFANAVGASCVTAIGATEGIKSLEDTMIYTP